MKLNLGERAADFILKYGDAFAFTQKDNVKGRNGNETLSVQSWSMRLCDGAGASHGASPLERWVVGAQT